MTKKAQSIYPIHELIANRWSPYCFDPRPVEPEKLATCLEAAIWAASSCNEQPWIFIVATRDNSANSRDCWAAWSKPIKPGLSMPEC